MGACRVTWPRAPATSSPSGVCATNAAMSEVASWVVNHSRVTASQTESRSPTSTPIASNITERRRASAAASEVTARRIEISTRGFFHGACPGLPCGHCTKWRRAQQCAHVAARITAPFEPGNPHAQPVFCQPGIHASCRTAPRICWAVSQQRNLGRTAQPKRGQWSDQELLQVTRSKADTFDPSSGCVAVG